MINEPTSDLVLAIVASPAFAEDGICFAARQSGLYRSVDGGRSWQFAYQSLKLKEVLTTQAVVISPDFVHDRTVLVGVNGGILRSTDAGKRWQIYQLPSPPPAVTSLAFSPDYMKDGTAFCGTMEDGVFCSTDRGTHWTAWNFGLLDLRILCLAVSPAFVQDETIFAGTESGIYRSRNGGRAWRAGDFLMDSAPVISLAFSPAYATDGTLYAGTENGELFTSTNGGKNWAVVARFGDPINQIVLGPDWQRKPELLLLVGPSLQYSRDAGQTWKKRRIRLPEADNPTCLAAPSGVSRSSPLLIGTVHKGVFLI
jgi:photosystem II stability/assembly factor-like uncharacterized protein